MPDSGLLVALVLGVLGVWIGVRRRPQAKPAPWCADCALVMEDAGDSPTQYPPGARFTGLGGRRFGPPWRALYQCPRCGHEVRQSRY